MKKINSQTGKSGVKWTADPAKHHPPFAKLVPLNEIISEVLGSPPTSVKVKTLYDQLTNSLGSEFDILLKLPVSAIEKAAGSDLANAILKVRNGSIYIRPGFDGEFGVVKINNEEEKEKIEQESLF